MRITEIDRLDAFEELRSDWEHLYARDPAAQVFLSWPWLRGWLETAPEAWRILLVHPGGGAGLAGCLPLWMHTRRRYGLAWYRELRLGGHPLADYTGLLADPEHQAAVIECLARHLAGRLPWDRFALREVHDLRLALLVEHLPAGRFELGEDPPTTCMRMDLQPSWEEYLSEVLRGSVRRNVRRALRDLELVPDFRISEATPETFGEHVEALLEIWQRRWGRRPEPYLDGVRATFESCLREGALVLRLLWSGERPFAGDAYFGDRTHGTVYEYINAFDPDFDLIRSPGLAAVALSLQHATEQGYEVYDFLRGFEDYKRTLGCEVFEVRNLWVERLGWRRRLRGLVRRLRGQRPASRP